MKVNLKKLTLTAMFLALGLLLPFAFGQLKQFGKMLLPMHIPVFLCSLICGWKYGLLLGFVLPLLRSALFSMPIFFPGACAMAFELAAYGFFADFIYSHLKKNISSLYISLILAMILGRIIWAIAQIILLGFIGKTFTFAAFVAGAFIEAFPGMILQLILIPLIIYKNEKIRS